LANNQDLYSRAKQAYPKKNVTRVEVVLVDGQLLATTEGLCSLFDCDRRTVQNWRAKGLLPSALSLNTHSLFDVLDTIEWKNENIPAPRSKKTGLIAKSKIKPKQQEINEQELEAMPAQEVDKLYKIEKLLAERLKRKVQEGEYVLKTTVDFAQSELAAVILSMLRQLRNLLPPLLENKNQEEMYEIIDKEFGHSVGMVSKIIQNEIGDVAPTAIDVLFALLQTEKSPEEILKAVNA